MNAQPCTPQPTPRPEKSNISRFFLIGGIGGGIVAILLLLAFRQGLINPEFLNAQVVPVGIAAVENEENTTVVKSVSSGVSHDSLITMNVEQPLDAFFQSPLGEMRLSAVNDSGTATIELIQKPDFIKRMTVYHLKTSAPFESPALYHEYTGKHVYSYFSYPYEQNVGLEVMKGDAIQDVSLPFQTTFNVWNDSSYHIFLIEAEGESGSIGYSDLLELPPQYALDRANTAKLLTQHFSFSLSEMDTYLPFTDVSTGHWAAPYVRALFERGYVQASNTFRPADLMSRVELISLLSDVLDLPVKVSGDGHHFTDVPETNSAYYAVESFYAAGYLKGFGQRLFPDTPITRHFFDYLVE